MKLIYTKQERPLLHPGYFEAVSILGAGNPTILNYLLRLTDSEHLIPGNMSGFVNYAERLDIPSGSATLVSNANGPVIMAPSKLDITTPVPYVLVEIAIQGSTAFLKSVAGTWVVPCWDAGSGLHIEWPEAFSINGDIGYPLPDSITLNIPVSYPVRNVVQKLTASSEVYDFLEKYGLESVYHTADRDEERIAMVVLAIIKETENE